MDIRAMVNWIRGDQWTCECRVRQVEGHKAQVKFIVNLRMGLTAIQFTRYGNVGVPDPVAVMINEIQAAAPDRGLTLTPRSLRRLRAALVKAGREMIVP